MKLPTGRARVRTWGLVLQPQKLFVPEDLVLLAAPLLPFGVLDFDAADSLQLDGRHSTRLGHFHLDPPGHRVPAAVERLTGVRKYDLEGFYSLRHRHHDADVQRVNETVNWLNVLDGYLTTSSSLCAVNKDATAPFIWRPTAERE